MRNTSRSVLLRGVIPSWSVPSPPPFQRSDRRDVDLVLLRTHQDEGSVGSAQRGVRVRLALLVRGADLMYSRMVEVLVIAARGVFGSLGHVTVRKWHRKFEDGTRLRKRWSS